MSPRHHPGEDLLLSHAAGGLDKPMSVLMATHLCFCARCRSDVALGERIGGALLDEIAPVKLTPDALVRTLARLDMPEQAASAVPESRDGTPAPLREFLGRDLSEMPWRSMGPRLGYVTLHRHGPVAMRLLRGAPGSNVGLHTHRGLEYTLVLRGGFTALGEDYLPGDLQIASDEITHDPVAHLDGDCINLSVTTDRLNFIGFIPSLVARLFGF